MISILAPVDFSDYTFNALDYAAKLGGDIPSEITLAHCFPEVFDEKDIEIPEGVHDIERLIRQKRKSERDSIEDIIEKPKAGFNENQRKNISLKLFFEIGYAKDILEKFIADNRIDIIAITRKKRNIISSFFHPAITRKILFHTIPLLGFHN